MPSAWSTRRSPRWSIPIQGWPSKVIADDALLDDGQREIDDKAIIIIAKRQPMADDLREIVGASASRPISSGSAISARTSPSGSSRSPRPPAAQPVPRPAGAGRAGADPAQGSARRLCLARVERIGFVRDRDDQIDAMYTSLFRELLTYMMEDPRNITRLHASAVLRQEHRAHRRPCDQHRRDCLLHRHRRADAAGAAEKRQDPPIRLPAPALAR